VSFDTFMEGVSNDLRTELVRSCPVDEGVLKASITMKIDGGEITIDMVDYWKYVEYGTAPHVITPKNPDGVLHWKKGGEDFFAKWVNHPGTRPQPFIRDTFNRKLKTIIQNNASLHLTEEESTGLGVEARVGDEIQ
jgi:HK97 gp10 family phage protein